MGFKGLEDQSYSLKSFKEDLFQKAIQNIR